MVEHADAVLHVPAERSMLAAIRDFIAARARSAGATTEQVDDLVLAVDELATNSIVHGYEDGPGELEVVCMKQPGSITVIIRDNAPLFDSTSYTPEPRVHLPLEERPLGGLGIYLVRKCVDRFEHRARPGGGNEVEIEKRLMVG